MATAGSIRIGVSAGVTDFKKDMGEARGILASFTATMSGGSRVSFDFFNGLNMVSGALQTVGDTVSGLVMASADQSEAMDLVRIMYADSADTVIAKADEMAAKFGTVRTEFLSGVGTLEGIIGSMGGTSEETANLANRFGELAVDMESAFNSDFSAELDRIRAGLSGEAEPLRRYGVDISDAAVQQEAMRLGLKDLGKELTNAQKITIRSNLIFEDLSKVMGNKELTSGSTANKVKELGGRFENLQADVGGAVEIIGNGFITVIGEGIIGATDGFDGLSESVQDWAKASLQTGGIVNTVFGVAGEGVAFFIDNVQFSADMLLGLGITVGNVFTGLVTTVIDAAMAIGNVYEAMTGQELGFLDTVDAFRDALAERNKELVAYRDNELFNGSATADSLRSFVASAKTRLDEIGSATASVIQSTEDKASEIAGSVAGTIGEAISSKVEFASALDFGSADALSAINRSRTVGKDTGVEVAKDQLGVQRQSLMALKAIEAGISLVTNETLDI